MVLGCLQGADVAVQHEAGAGGALDGFGDPGVGGVHQVADLAVDGLLPGWEGINVGVHTRVGRVGHGAFTLS